MQAEGRVKRSSSRSQQRLFRGELLSFTQKNAKVWRFLFGFEMRKGCDMEVGMDKVLKLIPVRRNRTTTMFIARGRAPPESGTAY